MARLTLNDVRVNEERRPCYAKEYVFNKKKCRYEPNGEEVKALFHCWVCEAGVVAPSALIGGHSGGTIVKTMALIELSEGTMMKVDPDDIRFDNDLPEGWFRPLSTKWVKTHEAYSSLVTLLACRSRITKKQIFAAIEEAVGNLGEALD